MFRTQGRSLTQLVVKYPRHVATLYRLGFLPIAGALNILLVDARRQRAPVQAFIELLRDEAARDRIRGLSMEPSSDEFGRTITAPKL